jgi:hypothetical protein
MEQFFFFSTVVGIELGLALARQVLYHFSHASSLRPYLKKN